MTEPLILGPAPEPDVPVTVNVGVVRQPSGRHAIRLEIVAGVAAYGLTIPPGTAAELASILPAALGQAVDAARRADLGLVVAAPSNGAVPPLP